MSVDAGFSNGPFILTDEKLPEVVNSAVVCENASSSGALVSTKEILNCPADKVQMEHNPASEITGTEEMSGESSGSGKGNDDEELSNESTEAANAGNSGDKLQCDQSVKTENADTDGGQEALSMVAEIKGVNERGGEFNGVVNLICEESANTDKVESNGQKVPSTEIKAVEEIMGESNGSRKNDKSMDAEKGDINNSMDIDPVTEMMVGMEGMRGESSGPRRSNDVRRLSEESADTEKVESDGQREPITVAEIKAVEEISSESNGSSKNDKSVDDEKGDINSSMAINHVTETVGMEEMRSESSSPHRSNDDKRLSEESAGAEKADSSEYKSLSDQCGNAGNDDSNGQSAPNVITKIKGINEIGGDSNCDVKLVCEGSADTGKVEINGQRAPSTVTEIGVESNDSSKVDESADAEKAGSNNSVATNIVTEISGLEGQSNGVDKINIISEISGIDVESNGAEEISNDKLVHQESTNIEKADSQGRKISHIVSEIKGIKVIEGEADVTNKRTDGNSTSEDRKDGEVANDSTPVHKGMSCNDEICHDQATLADLELSEVGNTSSSRDVSSYDAVTFEKETLTSPIEIDQESANMSIEIVGTEEMTGGSDKSNDDKLICEQSGYAEISSTNEVLATSAECSSVDVAAIKDINWISAKGFYFLIRMPRFDDEKIRERIKVVELNVDEKTQHRDAFRQKIRNKRANCQTHGAEFEVAKAQERDARKQVRTKRADISTLQDIIDKAKNAVAVSEIDNRIYNMEHIIGHETVPLKEEKLLIREIKQLKQLRGQLSSNIGSQDEVQKSLDEREINEERLRSLKKELENLKVKVSKAETIAMAASRKFEDESRKLKELQAQFKAADDIRQEAYEELRSLKKGLYEKNIHFRTYKDIATLASDHARKREMEALNHLCVNQVESYMELWNQNDEFRKDYIRCNTRSTVRRFGTLDGRTLGPDEEPAVIPSYRVERVDKMVASVDKVNNVSQPPVFHLEKQVVVLKNETKDDNIVLQAAELMKQVEKTKEARKPIQRESTVDEPKEAKQLQTGQELEAARKEEELRKREEEARLKEQRRLEEIAKAKEALERKKRNAEKAQLRAEMRAQKEEEQRLKEKEKRLRKRERKKGSVSETQSESNDGETALISTSPRETVKELEAAENSQTITRRTQKSSQYTKQMKTKSIPPPLRNKNRRKLQQWLWLFLSCLVVIALFLLGNIGFFSHMKPPKNPGY